MEEAQAGQSKPDFISKNAIALKEARETVSWLRLLALAKIMPAGRLPELQTEAPLVIFTFYLFPFAFL
jgi:four helix bundle protein